MKDILKRKMLLIAIVLFAISTISVFYLQEKDKLQISHGDLQAYVLQEGNEDAVLSEDEYRELIGDQNDDFAIVNLDRTFKFLSEDLLKNHGYSPSDVEEINVLTFIHPKDLPEFTNSLLTYHSTLEPVYNIGPLRVKTKSGEYLEYLLSLSPIKDPEGTRIGTAVILKNVNQPLGERNNYNVPSSSTETTDTETADTEATAPDPVIDEPETSIEEIETLIEVADPVIDIPETDFVTIIDENISDSTEIVKKEPPGQLKKDETIPDNPEVITPDNTNPNLNKNKDKDPGNGKDNVTKTYKIIFNNNKHVPVS